MTDLVQVREALVKRTKCATCRQGKYLPTKDGKTWIHLYEDGSFIGPCFDWVIASAFASLSQAADEIERLREAVAWIADDDPANSYEWQLIARKVLGVKKETP